MNGSEERCMYPKIKAVMEDEIDQYINSKKIYPTLFERRSSLAI